MKVLPDDRLALIDALVAETELGGVTAALLEKDEHLTDALRALFELPLDGLHLVFCGGSSLSKAHGLIERMSEDADLKVVLSSETEALSRGKLRNRLRTLKATVSETLAGIGLVEDTSKAQSLNENRYFRSEWSYERNYDSIAGLRPHLQVELTVRLPVLPTVDCRIGKLTDYLADLKGETFTASTVSVAETVAEKVLSFLRRFAQHRAGRMRQAWDTTLVRHIYDTHCVARRDPAIADSASDAFSRLVAGDQQEFGRQFPAFADNATAVLSGALEATERDHQTQAEYTENLLLLVYGNVKPPFAESFASFESIAKRLLASLPGSRVGSVHR
jgi:predicted nucleotidyltransferase component of viral defense system